MKQNGWRTVKRIQFDIEETQEIEELQPTQPILDYRKSQETQPSQPITAYCGGQPVDYPLPYQQPTEDFRPSIQTLPFPVSQPEKIQKAQKAQKEEPAGYEVILKNLRANVRDATSRLENVASRLENVDAMLNKLEKMIASKKRKNY
jgi:hypothetical protein